MNQNHNQTQAENQPTDDLIKNDAVILVDKPAGITSFGVVARIRRRLSEQLGKKAKVGHTGTLDPFATGLMIILTGKECKNAEKYSKLDKVYEAVVTLGQNSITGDPEGELSLVSGDQPQLSDVQEAIEQLKGQIIQRPPIYSAIKIGGRRAYDLARQGKSVEMPERQVTIYSLQILDYKYPELRLRVHVSSGTYIRTLAEDIGKALRTGAYCSQLRRTAVGEWSVDVAMQVEV